MNILAGILLFCFCDLGALFSDKSVWSGNSVDFTVDNARYGFEFASQKRDIVNCLKKGTCRWNGLDVWETRVYYGAEGIRRVEMSLYNRGDDKSGNAVRYGRLKEMLAEIASKVEPGGKIGRAVKTRLPTGGYRYVRKWESADPNVELTWGVNGMKTKDMTAQYIRVALYPKPETRIKRSPKPVSSRVTAKKIRDNVTENSSGDIWIQNVPMVDQGQKGYCAAAVAERVLRYYGHQIDEHEIAQLAGTSAQGGTSTAKMVETVRLMASKCKLGYQEIVMMIGGIKDIQKEVEMYNKAAKSEKEDEINMREFIHGNIIQVGAIKRAMKPRVVKKMRTKDSRFKKFLTGVRTQVDKGIPVLWGVTLGIFPEPGVPQTGGGHMRLIIGYNEKTREVLYTDTWGAGHELKRMPEDWAFVITNEAFFLRPL